MRVAPLPAMNGRGTVRGPKPNLHDEWFPETWNDCSLNAPWDSPLFFLWDSEMVTEQIF
jgi:hypothetical protein